MVQLARETVYTVSRVSWTTSTWVACLDFGPGLVFFGCLRGPVWEWSSSIFFRLLAWWSNLGVVQLYFYLTCLVVLFGHGAGLFSVGLQGSIHVCFHEISSWYCFLRGENIRLYGGYQIERVSDITYLIMICESFINLPMVCILNVKYDVPMVAYLVHQFGGGPGLFVFVCLLGGPVQRWSSSLYFQLLACGGPVRWWSGWCGKLCRESMTVDKLQD